MRGFLTGVDVEEVGGSTAASGRSLCRDTHWKCRSQEDTRTLPLALSECHHCHSGRAGALRAMLRVAFDPFNWCSCTSSHVSRGCM